MQKNDLIRELKNQTGLKRDEVKRFINAFGLVVGNSLSANQRVMISGLGTFEVRKRNKKAIINPNNPFEKIVLPERNVIKFIAGSTIKNHLKELAGSKLIATPAKAKPIEKSTSSVSPEPKKTEIKKSTTLAPLKLKRYSLRKESPANDKDTGLAKNTNDREPRKKTIKELIKEIASEVENKGKQPSYIKESIPPTKTQAIETPAETTKRVSSPQSHPAEAKKDKQPSYLSQSIPPSKLQTVKTPTETAERVSLPNPQQSAPVIPAKVPPSNPPIPKPAPAPEPTPVSKPLQPAPPRQLVPQPAAPAKPIIKKVTPFSDIHKRKKFSQKPVSSAPQERPTSSQGIKIPYLDLSKKEISKKILSKVPEYIARLYQAVPADIDEESHKLILAMVDPEDYQAMEFIKKKTGYQVEPRLATRTDIERILDQYSGIGSEVAGAISGTEFAGAVKEAAATTPERPSEEKEEVTSEAPTSRIVQSILRRAVASKASDVHIEPEENDVVVRVRIDGVLQKVLTLPKKIQAAIISRIKILSGMKIDEQRLPQDGRFDTKVHDRDIDFRVSTFPSINGEKIVMRILDKSAGILTLDELGLTGDGFKRLDEAIHKSHGMTLVTGPTGSGKTTTLYAVIDRIMSVGINIVTLEDPVEYQIKGINQGQVRNDIGFSFAKGLRSIVRQDPDVIMVGEIRDLETAEMAVHAALTGHIVLSTLHTNDAAGAIPRLIDMGVEPFLITSSLATVIGQRLARKICDHCKVEDKLSEEILTEIKTDIEALPDKAEKLYAGKTLKFYKGKGCPSCDKSGYKGRIGVFEVLPMTEGIADLSLKKVSAETLTGQALKEGMITMKQDGIIKALEGKTSIEEVWRVTKE